MVLPQTGRWNVSFTRFFPFDHKEAKFGHLKGETEKDCRVIQINNTKKTWLIKSRSSSCFTIYFKQCRAFDLLYYEMCLSPSYPLRLVLVLLSKTCSYSKHLSPFCDEFFIRGVVLQKFLPEEGIIYIILLIAVGEYKLSCVLYI